MVEIEPAENIDYLIAFIKEQYPETFSEHDILDIWLHLPGNLASLRPSLLVSELLANQEISKDNPLIVYHYGFC